MKKVFIFTANENWICNFLKDEWDKYNSDISVDNYNDADIIWILSDWCYHRIPMDILLKKKIIITIHHIDMLKINQDKIDHFKKLDTIVDHFHTICDITKQDLEKYVKKDIIVHPFWVNQNKWFHIDNKIDLRNKYDIDDKCHLIGSFQRDTEGKGIIDNIFLPKLSKGPDIFCDIIDTEYKKNKNIQILLCGWRRQYVINRLETIGIKYYYFEMVDDYKLNELYNCLDLYLVSSRTEGGPRAITECAMAKIPIVSTNVGIASDILAKESIYDIDNFNKAKANTEVAYTNVQKLKINECFDIFRNKVLL